MIRPGDVLLLTLACLGGVAAAWDAASPPAPPSWALPSLPTPPTLTSPPLSTAHTAGVGRSIGFNARNVFALAAPGALSNLDVPSAGAWAALPDGSHLLRLAITTPGAPSHVLLFSDVRLPPGATLHLWGWAADARTGSACSHACQAFHPGAPPLAAGPRLTSLELEGETVHLEVRVPEGGKKEEVRLVLARVMAGLGGVGLGSAPPAPAPSSRRLAAYTQGTQFDFGLLQQRMDATAPCTPSVTCAFPALKESAAAVVSIYAVNLAVGAVALCTGTIISAPLGAKYLLTAHHCLADEQAVNSFEYWVLAFNHEAKCGALLAPPATQLMQGARLRFYDSSADILLLGLPYPVPDRFKHYRLGYDASPGAAVPKGGAFIVHHPRGNFKRVSFVNDTSRPPPTPPDPTNETAIAEARALKGVDWGGIRTAFVARPFPAGEVQPTDATHVQVAYSTGATQGGSSGAPLIDALSGRVIGVLSGGFASCRVPGSPDYFGLLSRAPGLRQFLSSAKPALGGRGGGGGGGAGNGTAPYSAEIADQLVALADGKVVVDRLKGSAPPTHGPTVGFYPTFLALGGNVSARTFAFFLTDPPWANETIRVSMAVATDVVGNLITVNGSSPEAAAALTIDNRPAAGVELSRGEEAFTLKDWDARERSVTVTLPPAAAAALSDGGLARFRIIFSLSSDVDPSYAAVATLAGVVQRERADWATAAPRKCTDLPCASEDPGSKAPPGVKAVFEYTPTARSTASVVLCLEPGVLPTAAVSVYVDRKIKWSTSRDAYGNPDCVSILGYDVRPGVSTAVVVSDAFDLSAVLPLTLVRSVELTEEWREGASGGVNGTTSGDAAVRAAAEDAVKAAAYGAETAPPVAAPDAPGAASTAPALVGVAAVPPGGDGPTSAGAASTVPALAAAPAQPDGAKADTASASPRPRAALPPWLTASRSAVTAEQLADKGMVTP